MKWQFKDRIQPLERRTYKYKNPHMEFFCPLCRTQRAIVTRPRLNRLNYMQIVMISAALISVLWQFMEHRSLFVFFVVWIAFEMGVRMLFRKEVPCPHCGFDASWYKRDVKVARQKVAEFWATREKKSEDSVSNASPAEGQLPAYDDGPSEVTFDDYR